MKAFIITAIAQQDDERAGIHATLPIFVGEFRWSPTISNARWFETRDHAIDFMLDLAYTNERAFLTDRLLTSFDAWQIIEMDYELKHSAVERSERDERIRRNVLRRLTAEEKRVLGLVNNGGI